MKSFDHIKSTDIKKYKIFLHSLFQVSLIVTYVFLESVFRPYRNRVTKFKMREHMHFLNFNFKKSTTLLSFTDMFRQLPLPSSVWNEQEY